MAQSQYAPNKEQSEAHAELAAVINAHMPTMGALQLMALTAELTGRLLNLSASAGVAQEALRQTIFTNISFGAQTAELDKLASGAFVASGGSAVN